MIFSLWRKKDKKGFYDLPDHELILEYKDNKDPEIISVLIDRYIHLVYGVCLKYFADKDDAKDAVMEIFESLIDSIPEHEIRNFKNWLYSVTRNHCLMRLRKTGSAKLAKDLYAENNHELSVESEEELHQDMVQEEYARRELETAMMELKEAQRLCLDLVYLKDKSYQEVCEITGYTMNEVKSHVQNGKRNLKIRLESTNER